ncbi:MAG: TetR/AcrR family transcriptional regulator [Spirochaetaceae bacterium]|nr:MAG: TetR/AcrR family transcriptional regulator [Spirochaetaceae bacterium]
MRPRATRRKEQAQQTRAAIMEHAQRLFRERGFEAVTIEEITEAAGVARGSFYTYFKNKSEIIIAEFRDIDDYYRRYAVNLKRYKSAGDKLLAFTRAQMRYVRDTVGNENLKVLYANQTIEPGAVKIINNRDRFWYHLIRDTIAEGQAAGEFRVDRSPEQLADWFNRTIRGHFLEWCISSGEEFDLIKEGEAYCSDWIIAALRR